MVFKLSPRYFCEFYYGGDPEPPLLCPHPLKRLQSICHLATTRNVAAAVVSMIPPHSAPSLPRTLLQSRFLSCLGTVVARLLTVGATPQPISIPVQMFKEEGFPLIEHLQFSRVQKHVLYNFSTKLLFHLVICLLLLQYHPCIVWEGQDLL